MIIGAPFKRTQKYHKTSFLLAWLEKIATRPMRDICFNVTCLLAWPSHCGDGQNASLSATWSAGTFVHPMRIGWTIAQLHF